MLGQDTKANELLPKMNMEDQRCTDHFGSVFYVKQWQNCALFPTLEFQLKVPG